MPTSLELGEVARESDLPTAAEGDVGIVLGVDSALMHIEKTNTNRRGK